MFAVCTVAFSVRVRLLFVRPSVFSLFFFYRPDGLQTSGPRARSAMKTRRRVCGKKCRPGAARQTIVSPCRGRGRGDEGENPVTQHRLRVIKKSLRKRPSEPPPPPSPPSSELLFSRDVVSAEVSGVRNGSDEYLARPTIRIPAPSPPPKLVWPVVVITSYRRIVHNGITVNAVIIIRFPRQ